LIGLPDAPGSLIELIKPISNNGGNIFGILHQHNKKINNMIPVSINFELNKELMETNMSKIKHELNEKNIKIEEIILEESEKEIRHLMVILTGHVFESDLTDTIKRLSTKNINVSEVQAKITEIADASNVIDFFVMLV